MNLQGNAIYSDAFSEGLIGVLVVLFSCLLLFTVFAVLRPTTTKRLLFTLFVVWALLPPVWFSIEYHVLYPRFGNPAMFDRFKYGQDVSAKVWAAMVAIVTARMIMIGGPHDIFSKRDK